MFPRHIFYFDKTKELFEGFIVHHGMTFFQQVKQNNKLDLFLIIPDLPQNPIDKPHHYENI